MWYESGRLVKRISIRDDGYCRLNKNSLAGLVAKPPVLGLATSKDISSQSLATIQATNGGRLRRCSRQRAIESRLDQWPATSDPVTVTPIHKFIGPSGKASLRGILSGRKPGEEQRQVHAPN